MGRADENLTKVHVTFRDGGGEFMWAKAIEGDLFAIRNLPFVACGLNFGDVVLAPDRAGVREVQRVVRPSGHRTLRIVFGDHVSEPEQEHYLNAMREHGGSGERATARLVAIDAPPEADFETMVAVLTCCETMGELHFETCEARVPGSFDDVHEGDVAA